MKRGVIFLLIGILLSINLPLIKSQEVSTSAIVEVNPVYALDIEIHILSKKILNEENLGVLIELEKEDISHLSNEISVDLNYEIVRGKNVVESGFLKRVNIIEDREDIIEIPISSDLRGSYNLRIIASNPQSYSDEDEDRFIILKKSGFVFLPFFFNLTIKDILDLSVLVVKSF